MSAELQDVLKSAGKLHTLTNYVSSDSRARLRRAVRQARRQGADWAAIAAMAELGISTVQRIA